MPDRGVADRPPQGGGASGPPRPGSREPKDDVYVCQGRIRVIRVGWFAFEGLGRPFEAWVEIAGLRGVGYVSDHDEYPSRWRCVGRALTRRGARRRARPYLEVRADA